MDELERKLYERKIDYTTPNAQRFLTLCKKHHWDVKFFLDLAVKLKYFNINERKISPNGRWRGKPSNYGRQRKRIRN
jgi:hypothetical protein